MISRLKLKLLFSTIFFLIADLQGAYSLQVPFFLTNIPSGHFAGVSAPCPTLTEARKAATLDVVRQVLGSMGTSYGYIAKHLVKGNVRGESLQRNIEETFRGTAKGVVLDVEQNIVRSSWSKDVSGNFVYFVLVRYPEKMIAEMRRLSKGARLIAKLIQFTGNEIKLKVSEANGVAVTIASADIKFRRHNRFSKAISLFLWKIPSMVEHNSSISIDPVEVCGNSVNIQLSTGSLKKSFTDYLLGAYIELNAILNGYDEIGRIVSVKIEI